MEREINIARRSFGVIVVMLAVMSVAQFVLPPVALAQNDANWIPTGSLNIPRHGATATLLPNGKVLVVGGWRYGEGELDSAELYDPSTGTWSFTGNLNRPRDLHTATLLPNGKVLVAGGLGDASSTSAELYDPATNTWSLTGDLSTGRFWHTATLLTDGRVLVAGGSTAELYDPATGAWSVTGDPITVRFWPTATLLQNGKVLIAGGLADDDVNTILPTAELYDPATGTWSITGSLNVSRYSFTTTLLPNGKVLAAGGYLRGVPAMVNPAGPQTSLNSAELYDPATGTWSIAASLNMARDSHTATLLPNGKVLVAAGGYWSPPCGDGCSYNPLSSAELYDPTSDGWSITASLNTPRVGATATRLQNGQVLVAGGDSLGSAELYLMLPSLDLVGFNADQVSPQPAGATINFTATTTGGLAPIQYKWWVFNGGAWEVVKDWSNSNTFNWTPGFGGNYKIGVWTKSSVILADAPQNSAFAGVDFTINAPPGLVITGLTPDQASPQPAGATINFTATTTGGLAPIQYKWWVFNGGAWEVVKDWSNSNTFNWTPGFGGSYKIGVWTKSSVILADAPENNAFAGVDFTINSSADPSLTLFNLH